MKKNLKASLKKINKLFSTKPSAKVQSWSLLDDFYHLLLTYMENEKISRTKLSKRLGVSRSAISQLFNQRPNVTLNKISDIAVATGLRLKLTSEQIEQPKLKEKVIIMKLAPSFYYTEKINETQDGNQDKCLNKVYESNYKVVYPN